jgi:aminopeptidase N
MNRFQLTLKEGLTVFRDQWFSSDETSHAVKRVEDVRGLRSRQFPEDQVLSLFNFIKIFSRLSC